MLCAYNAAELKMENKPYKMLSVIEAGNKKPQITILRDLDRKGHKPFGDCRCFWHLYDTIQKQMNIQKDTFSMSFIKKIIYCLF